MFVYVIHCTLSPPPLLTPSQPHHPHSTHPHIPHFYTHPHILTTLTPHTLTLSHIHTLHLHTPHLHTFTSHTFTSLTFTPSHLHTLTTTPLVTPPHPYHLPPPTPHTLTGGSPCHRDQRRPPVAPQPRAEVDGFLGGEEEG